MKNINKKIEPSPTLLTYCCHQSVFPLFCLKTIKQIQII